MRYRETRIVKNVDGEELWTEDEQTLLETVKDRKYSFAKHIPKNLYIPLIPFVSRGHTQHSISTTS